REEIVRVFKFAMLGQMLIRKFFFILEHEGKREVVTTSGINSKPKKRDINNLFELDDDLVQVDENLREEVPFLRENDIQAIIGLQFQNEKIALVGVGPRA